MTGVRHNIDASVWPAFFNESPDPCFVYEVGTPPKPRFTMAAVNPAWLEVTGLPADIVGKSLQQLMPPEVAKVIEQRLERSVESRVHLSYEEELRFRNEARYWRTTVAPVVLEGAVRFLVCFGHDLTDMRNNAELERRLQHTQKLESLGVMAGGVAHDFNNLLTGILGHISLMRNDPLCGPELQSHAEQIETAAQRAADLCRQMLAYSGRGRLTNKPIELDALVRETTQLLGLSMSKTTQLQLLLGAEGIFVQGDPVQLQQVIMNLVLNASEACEDKAGLIKVTTGRESPNRSSEPRVDRVLDILDGEFLFLEVADNGAGMTPQTQARMFDPFFTTKFTGRGLGLSAVLGIIRGHAGGVGVESELGRGTTFRVLLPIVNAEQALLASATPSAPAPALHTTGTILVVDDEELVRKVAVSVLESLGLKVVTAGNGREGVERVLASNPPFAAVLMDLTMPVLDGVSAIDELRRAQNPVPVILMSGYSEQDAGARFADKGVAGFLQKPFTPQMVSQQLALVLRR